jgi:cell division protein FtsW
LGHCGTAGFCFGDVGLQFEQYFGVYTPFGQHKFLPNETPVDAHFRLGRYLCFSSCELQTFQKMGASDALRCHYFAYNHPHFWRWIVVPGIGISFQTSDLAKIAIITYVASKLTDTQEYIRSFSEAFMPIIVPIMVVCALIGIADLSTGAVIFVTCLLMMFIGRVAFKYIFLLCFSALVTFALLILIDRATDLGRVDTWISRINSFLSNPDGETQTQLAKMAIAEGGLFGNGPGNSIQKNHLPMAWTDYIYAVSIEEYGLVGAFVLMGLFLLLFFRVVRMVTIGSKTFGAMLAMGLALILVMQALANMAVSVHLVPVMGLPMPMVSMGGTSLLFSCAALGMILSVSKNIEEEKNLSL